MGRDFRDVAVIKAYSANSQFVDEEVIPLSRFDDAASVLLNSAPVRQDMGIRFISVRLFDVSGNVISSESFSFHLDGGPAHALHRRKDGTIIEDADKYLGK